MDAMKRKKDDTEVLAKEAEQLIAKAQAQPGLRELMEVYKHACEITQVAETYQSYAQPPQTYWVSDSTVSTS